jgi:glyceraldehyde 3-phosphate dehydrogenase
MCDFGSSDIIGSSGSRVYDAGVTMVAGNVVKVRGWYDNE